MGRREGARALDHRVAPDPDAATGFGLVEARLLAAFPVEWDRAARAVGTAMIGEASDATVGDGILFARLRELATAPRPCVEMRGDRAGMRRSEGRVTPFGLDCLAGRASHVAANGIDAWAGGVHLSSAAGRVWFRRAGGGLVPG